MRVSTKARRTRASLRSRGGVGVFLCAPLHFSITLRAHPTPLGPNRSVSTSLLDEPEKATGTLLAIQGCAVRGMRGLSSWETSRAAPSPVEQEDRRARKRQRCNNLDGQATRNKASAGILSAPTNPFTAPQSFIFRAVGPLELFTP